MSAAGKVKTRILRIDPEAVDDRNLDIMGRILLNDGVMAYPTETFYGLGALCLSKQATNRIYGLKERDAGKPLSLIAADLDMVAAVAAEPPGIFFSLAEEFWPGPLTLVLKAAPTYPAELAGPGPSIAVRIPPIAWIRRLVFQIGIPITATSANISGEKEISEGAEVAALFKGKVDLIVDGGTTPGLRPSTIVDLTGDRPRILREGAIPLSALAKYLDA
jgi:L-threonylcarbamoyladenylate synthase